MTCTFRSIVEVCACVCVCVYMLYFYFTVTHECFFVVKLAPLSLGNASLDSFTVQLD